MPISSKTLIAVQEEGPVERKPRTKKADRPFSPPTLGYASQDGTFVPIELRPSRYRLAERVNDHYARLRNDRAYGNEYRRFVVAEKMKRLSEQKSLLEKPSKGTKTPPRVRASELKDCARQVTMRLMGFDAAPVGENSPHWNIAALSGEELHEEIELALKFLKLSYRSEFTVSSQSGDFSGRVDHELDPEAFREELGDDAVAAVLDVKTVGPDDYKEGTWSSKVPGFIAQISAYGRILGDTVGVVLMVDRGTGRMFDFEFDIDPAYGDRMLLRAERIVERVKAKKLPKPEFYENGKPSFKCFQFCPFFRQCRIQEEDGSIQVKLNQGVDPKEL